MTNWASRFMSVENSLDLVLFLPNPVGFVPVDFRMAYRTIEKFHVGSAFQFSPASLAIRFPQSLALADGFAGRNHLHILDASDDLEVHESAPLKTKGGRMRPPLHELSSCSRWCCRNFRICSSCRFWS